MQAKISIHSLAKEVMAGSADAIKRFGTYWNENDGEDSFELNSRSYADALHKGTEIARAESCVEEAGRELDSENNVCISSDAYDRLLEVDNRWWSNGCPESDVEKNYGEEDFELDESMYCENLAVVKGNADEYEGETDEVILNEQAYDDLEKYSKSDELECNAKTKEEKSDNEQHSGDEDVSTFLLAKRMLGKYIFRKWPGENGIRVYDGSHFTPLSVEELGNLVYQEIPYYIKRKMLSCTRIKAGVIDFIKDETYANKHGEENLKYAFSPDQIDAIRGKVALKNGVYNVYTDCLEEFSPELPLSYCLDANFLEDEEELPTPSFDKLVSDACCGDAKSIEMIEYVFGSMLLPNKSKKFPVVGPASNSGKSVLFGHLLEHIMPVQMVSHVSLSELSNRFGLGDAEGKTIISCLDVDTDTIPGAAAGVIKRCTGEDWVRIQQKYGIAHDVYCQFKFLFGTNSNHFCTSKYDAGWANRVMAVPFIHETLESDIDYSMPDKLIQEKDYIVTKILRKMRHVISGDGYIHIPESEQSLKLKNEWVMPKTFFPEFFTDVIEVTGDKADNYSRKELYGWYCQYFRVKSVNGTKFTKLTEGQFISNLLKYGNGMIFNGRVTQSGKQHFQNAVYRICGVRLKQSNESDIFDNVDRKMSNFNDLL